MENLNLNDLSVMELKDLRKKITFILQDKCHEANKRLLAELRS